MLVWGPRTIITRAPRWPATRLKGRHATALPSKRNLQGLARRSRFGETSEVKSTSRPAKQSLLRPGRPRRHPLPGAPQAGLVLAFAHERAQCAQALADCEAWRDAIASLDSDIEELRGELIASANISVL